MSGEDREGKPHSGFFLIQVNALYECALVLVNGVTPACRGKEPTAELRNVAAIFEVEHILPIQPYVSEFFCFHCLIEIDMYNIADVKPLWMERREPVFDVSVPRPERAQNNDVFLRCGDFYHLSLKSLRAAFFCGAVAVEDAFNGGISPLFDFLPCHTLCVFPSITDHNCSIASERARTVARSSPAGASKT